MLYIAIGLKQTQLHKQLELLATEYQTLSLYVGMQHKCGYPVKFNVHNIAIATSYHYH